MAKTGKKAATQRHWFKLDNAAKIFPGQNTKTWSNIFRISTVLKYKIEPALLERALENVLPRFPCYDVRMRRGFFWYILKKMSIKFRRFSPTSKTPVTEFTGVKTGVFCSEYTIMKTRFP